MYLHDQSPSGIAEFHQIWPPELDVRTKESMSRLLHLLWQELEQNRLRPDDAVGIQDRKRRLVWAFQQAAPWDAAELHDRLTLRLPNDEVARLFHYRLATPTRQLLLQILRQRKAGSTLLGPADLSFGQAPSRTAGRTLHLTHNDVASALPKVVRDSAKAEAQRLFAFVGGRRRKPLTVTWRSPQRFPSALSFSDSVVSLVNTSVDLAAHVNAAIRQQRNNAVHWLKGRGFNVTMDSLGRPARAVPERAGIALLDKRMAIASNRKRLAFPFMSAAVALRAVMKEVADEIKDGEAGKAIRQRRRSANTRYWGSAQALIDQRHLEDIKLLAAHPDDATKWPATLHVILGTALGKAIAHEARHLYIGSGHANIGLGADEPRLIGDPNFNDFSAADQADIVKAIQQLEASQRNAILVETFPAAKRKADFPF